VVVYFSGDSLHCFHTLQTIVTSCLPLKLVKGESYILHDERKRDCHTSDVNNVKHLK
jgi:hypothetical protein